MPERICTYLNLPTTDQGIDLIAETIEGEFWAVQCKYRDDDAASLTWEEVSTFIGLSKGICKNISYSLIAFSGERFARLLHDSEYIGFLSGEAWHRLGEQFFAELHALAAHQPIERAARTPRPHQARAVEKAAAYFAENGNTRGKLIMPCGTGKSLTAFWIAEELEATTILIAVPSLSLMRQTLHVWLEELAAREREVRWLCVCSDETVGERERDDVAIYAQDLGVPCATDEPTITEWLRRDPGSGLRIVFTTYQSGKVLASASRAAGTTFDLGLFDEAHKTVGQKGKVFGHLLFDEHVRVTRRVFITATERRYAGQGDGILSMDDPTIYGETFELLSFKEALEQAPPILADYKVITMLIDEAEIAELIERNAYLRPEGEGWEEEIEAQSLAALIALRKAIERYSIRHAVSFHSSITRARRFREANDRYSQALPDAQPLSTFHVTGAMPTSVREREVRSFAEASHALITNARCLTEGVDVPLIDCVLFADPKQSTVDIVQAVGRALRTYNGKACGYVIVPVITRGESETELIESNAFGAVLRVLRALAANDERIIEYFRPVAEGRQGKGDIIDIAIDEKIAQAIDLASFVSQVEMKVWSKLARLSWKPYEEAIKFVHRLNLKGVRGWEAYLRGERPGLPQKPSDIPASPRHVYGKEFKVKGGWGGWFGTGTVAPSNRKYLTYMEALPFVHALKMRNQVDWFAYCRGERSDLPEKPDNIPADPRRAYGEEFRMNGGWGGWFGTGYIAQSNRKYLSYDEAQSFVRALRLENVNAWKAYCRGERPDLPAKPDNIPVAIHKIYGKEFKDKGGMSGWLGNNQDEKTRRK